MVCAIRAALCDEERRDPVRTAEGLDTSDARGGASTRACCCGDIATFGTEGRKRGVEWRGTGVENETGGESDSLSKGGPVIAPCGEGSCKSDEGSPDLVGVPDRFRLCVSGESRGVRSETFSEGST